MAEEDQLEQPDLLAQIGAHREPDGRCYDAAGRYVNGLAPSLDRHHYLSRAVGFQI